MITPGKALLLLGVALAATKKEHGSPEAQVGRLKAAGYMQLPGKAGGFSCGRCHFASSRDGVPFCGNQNVQAAVSPESGCCNLFFPAGDPPVDPSQWPASGVA